MTATVIINEATCYHAPPGRTLEVGVVNDVVFFDIHRLEDDTDEVEASISVDLFTLNESLKLLLLHQTRMDDPARMKIFLDKNCCGGAPISEERTTS